ncbi:ROK family protein [Clostridium sp.]|uniref:ROK family protein n=1 Tax=Clostridium sp. TaxID=1506 RepID=UPI00260D1FC9|nr:ROK family protein [Clostridium sp.]
MQNYIVYDIGGSSIKYAIMNDDGDIIKKDNYKTSTKDFDVFIKDMIEIAKKAKDEYKVSGVAVSAPGGVDSETGIIGGSSALPCIHGPNFKEIFKDELNLILEIENDANCAALGEVWKGAARENKDVAFIVCGTGIGGAIIKDRKIHKGENLHGGEFGYMILETIYSESGVEFKTWSDLGATGGLSKNVANRKDLSPKDIDGKQVFQMAEDGDDICIQEIENFYLNNAKGIYNVQYIYDPEKILIGGAISEREDFIDRINENIDFILSKLNHAKVRPIIERCKFGNDANLIGALFNYKQRN